MFSIQSRSAEPSRSLFLHVVSVSALAIIACALAVILIIVLKLYRKFLNRLIYTLPDGTELLEATHSCHDTSPPQQWRGASQRRLGWISI